MNVTLQENKTCATNNAKIVVGEIFYKQNLQTEIRYFFFFYSNGEKAENLI